MKKPQKRDRESMAQLLRRQGITPTHQRMEIAHVLFTRREHLSADQILVAGQLALRRDLEGDGLQHAQAVRREEAHPRAGGRPGQDRLRPQHRTASPPLRRRRPDASPTSPRTTSASSGCRLCPRERSPRAWTSSSAPAPSSARPAERSAGLIPLVIMRPLARGTQAGVAQLVEQLIRNQ